MADVSSLSTPTVWRERKLVARTLFLGDCYQYDSTRLAFDCSSTFAQRPLDEIYYDRSIPRYLGFLRRPLIDSYVREGNASRTGCKKFCRRTLLLIRQTELLLLRHESDHFVSPAASPTAIGHHPRRVVLSRMPVPLVLAPSIITVGKDLAYEPHTKNPASSTERRPGRVPESLDPPPFQRRTSLPPRPSDVDPPACCLGR